MTVESVQFINKQKFSCKHLQSAEYEVNKNYCQALRASLKEYSGF